MQQSSTQQSLSVPTAPSRDSSNLDITSDNSVQHIDVSSLQQTGVSSAQQLDIRLDIWYVENQIPFFILEDLFELAKTRMINECYEGVSMNKLISNFCGDLCELVSIRKGLLEINFCETKHFLDLIRRCLEPPASRQLDIGNEFIYYPNSPTITELHQAGVKFRVGTSRHLFDIRFDKGTLEIPKLRIENVGFFLLNVQIFEGLHCNANYMNDYALLLSLLVTSPKDAELLIENGIIENTESVAASNLCKKLGSSSKFVYNKFYYTGLARDLNAYCKSPWHKWKANLKQNYFNTPWASISVIAAVLCENNHENVDVLFHLSLALAFSMSLRLQEFYMYLMYDNKPAIIKLIHDFTKESWDFSEIDDNLEKKNFNRVEHLVDFLSICLVPSESDRPKKTKLETLTTPSVTELHQAGVKFKKASKKSLFDIEFNYGSGILEIPHLKIVKETELLFRNLLAFEQCHGSSNCINDFIVLINHLVNTPKDVDLLIQFGIIENWLWDSDGVSTLFHSLVKETSIIPENFYFSCLVEDMNGYCRTRWHRWKATLKQDYFRNPWAGISVFAAIVLLALTFIQTIYSVLKK
ncbi:hypothetical protein JRO89_XS10G0039400 [Xanthoceras sorbifolium]|uniref:Uncharacterized protein n=1 Tax=Xanthoceras sorbifolium TaxID=99658 RepID=A0ABQ8HHM2_9ROSI|nr:hypothetical protein JRO89_XS10G0039400 [Xanthoceras sorbifolium]